jgi:Protein of unknown function (DUF3039)
VTATTTDTRRVTDERDTTEPGKVAHIIYDKSKVTAAYIEGTPVTAFCGKVFVPSRDPKNLARCEPCIEAYREFFGRDKDDIT